MDTREKIITIAQNEFLHHGYKYASLTKIAELTAIKPASIYHHFPKGKEEIYLTALQAQLEQYQKVLSCLLLTSTNLDSYLISFAEWYAEQPPMNMQIITQMDMPALSKRGRDKVNDIIFQNIFMPLNNAIFQFKSSLKSGIHINRFIGLFFSVLTSICSAIKSGYDDPKIALRESLNMIFHGVLVSEPTRERIGELV